MVSLMVKVETASQAINEDANFLSKEATFVLLVGTLEACVDSRQMVYGWGR